MVTGCLAQRYSDEMQVEIPEVDAVLGTTAIVRLADALDEVLKGQRNNYIEDINKAPQGGRHRVVTTGGYYAYLKIAEGVTSIAPTVLFRRCVGTTAAYRWSSCLRKRRSLQRAV